KPVPGVTNPTPPPAKPVEAAKPAEKPAGKPAEQPAASDEPGSTSRLLRAKRRAQDKKDEP
ncbi:MAG: hypothetical protein ACO1SX_09455, partial [Actinomycetota bacterium]